jgi:hypothetical protein
MEVLMTKNIEPFHILIEIPMALAPIPGGNGNPDAREYREEQIQSAAKAAMAGGSLLKGPLSVSLSMSYAPSASMRRGHTWRVVNPSAWDLSRFILPLLQGICFVSAGQIAKLEVTKVFGARALTVVTIKSLVE